MKVIILGYGSRGRMYALEFKKSSEVEVVGACDVREDQLQMARLDFGEKIELFHNADELFAREKFADLCVVSTQDPTHREYAIKAMERGYHILLEKPIATSVEDCEAIYEASVKYDRKVYVCHVLRYAPFFTTIKEKLNSGEYGKVAVISLTENVGHWHQAHSFVRGNWAITENSTPMIIAKSCHDLDILAYLIGEKCKSVSSFGSLEFFTRENAPENSGDRCMQCPVQKDCLYDAEKFYITDQDKWNGKPLDEFPRNVLVNKPTVEKLYEAIKTGPYGRCAFKCENTAIDRQVVNISFENGVLASFVLTAFSSDCYREIHVHCEKGDIYGNMTENRLTCSLFGTCAETAKVEVIDLNAKTNGFAGHGGGDALMVQDVIDDMQGRTAKGLTLISHSLRSHFIGFAAEKSRLAGGAPIVVNK